MSMIERFSGEGQLIAVDGRVLAGIHYQYDIDRTNRVWSGLAVPHDTTATLAVSAGPALLQTEEGHQAPIHFRQRSDASGSRIVFTGRGAPPGE